MSKDYYKTLGVGKSASKDEIKKAFRKLAHEHHPDKKDGNAAKFKEASEAYSILSDDSKRAQYDQFGSGFSGGAGAQGQGGGFNASDFGGFDFSGFQQGGGFGQGFNGEGVEFDLNDIFGGIFGGQSGGRSRASHRRGKDISVDVELSFKDSVFGIDKTLVIDKNSTCAHCHGSRGEPGSGEKTCPTCNGNGQVNETRRSILGNFSSVKTCPECNGSGKVPKEKCKVCKGAGVNREKESITFKIPSGIDNEETLRVIGKGEAVPGGITGDLYIKVHVQRHPLFVKQGNDLIMNLPIKLSEALIGGEETIETLDGKLTVKVPSGIAFGEVLRVREKGVPIGNRRGDLLINISIQMPKKLSKEAKKLIEGLKKEGI